MTANENNFQREYSANILEIFGTTSRFVRWQAAIVGAVMLGAFLFVFFLSSQQRETESAAVASEARNTDVVELLSNLKDAEAGQRGYLLTGDPVYLQPYNHALVALPGLFDHLRGTLSADPERVARFEHIEALSKTRLKILRDGIALYDSQGQAAATAFLRGAGGRATMDEIRREVEALRTSEDAARSVIERRLKLLQTTFNLAAAAVVVGSLILFAMMLRTTGRRAELAETERLRQSLLLKSIIETSSDAIYAKDLAGRYTQMNGATARMMGERALVGLRDNEIYPDGRWEAIVENDRLAIDSPGGLTFEETSSDPISGAARMFLTSKTPLRDEHGVVIGVVGMSKDISERKRAEELQQLLLNELNHRVKNTLAVLHAIVLQTFRDADPATHKVFEGRLTALSDAHNILTLSKWKGAPMAAVVDAAVSAQCGGDQALCRRGGPDLDLSPQVALALTMTLHELCTNAIKHGALSQVGGTIALRWALEGDGAEERLVIDWRERGGPTVAEPARIGFGTKMIQRGLAADPKSSVVIAYRKAGLTCAMTLARFRATAEEKLVA